ncbi:unnamed protein product [Clavelina lepadiformis]|uniref:LisH domain-containing protein n=1 Tax=Clavelina lepadiformis TaxID=159417 RepID=A0ABP0FNC4_CLALP
MYSSKPPKSNAVPSDAQAREKLAMYVYEYLLNVGAGKSAHTFLQEIGWDKNIAVGESPGFLHSWWCVFWDLYCASPERRDTCEHSPEAKAFHDYSAATAPSPSMSSMPPDGIVPAGMPPGYFPPGSAASPSPHHNPNNPLMRQGFMSPARYPPGGVRPGMQGPGPQPMFQGSEHPRQGQMIGISRMVHPRGMPPGPMGPYGPDQFQQPYGAMRLPANTLPGHTGMGMSMHGRSPWANPSGAPSGSTAGGPPGTPIMRSPQDPMNSEFMNKSMSHQIQSSFPMGSVPENLPSTTIPMSGGPGLPPSTQNMTPGLNGMNGSGPDQSMIDGLPKNSPSNNMAMNSIPGAPAQMGPPGGPGGTPHTPQDGGEGDFMVPFSDNQNESAAILKIKESMQQEAKLFETKDGDGNGEFSFMS